MKINFEFKCLTSIIKDEYVKYFHSKEPKIKRGTELEGGYLFSITLIYCYLHLIVSKLKYISLIPQNDYYIGMILKVPNA